MCCFICKNVIVFSYCNYITHMCLDCLDTNIITIIIISQHD